MALADRIRSIFGGARTTTYAKSIEYTAIASVTIPANQPANSLNPVSIQIDPQQPPVENIRVYPDETWVIEDMFITTAPGVEGVVRVIRNNRDIVFQSNPLSVYNVNNPARPGITPIVMYPDELYNFFYVNTSPGQANAITVTFYLKLRRLVK